MANRPAKLGSTTLVFLCTEILCYFLFSIWWRVGIPLWVGIGLAFCHLVMLLFVLWLWERWKTGVDLGVAGRKPGPVEDRLPGALILLLVLGLSAQWFFFGDPVLSGPDEPVMIRDHSKQVSSLLASGPMVVTALVVSCFAILAASLRLVSSPASGYAPYRALVDRWPWFALLGLATIGYGMAEGASRINWGLAERWPPLGTVLLLPLSLMGLDEVLALRLLSALFYCGTAYLVFRIVRMESSRLAGLGASVLLMTAPAFFNWGHYAFREMGGVFFFTLGVHCLQRLLHWRRADDYALVFAVTALGYLQRRPTALLAVVAGITILLAFRQRLFTLTNLRVLALPALAMVWVVLPWIAISSNVRVYVLYLEHLIAPDTLLSYALALPGQVGWPLLVLSISGLIAGLLAWRKVVGIVLCWMLFLNFLFVMDVTAPRVIDRFAIHFVPGLAILAGIALGALDGRKLVAASVLAALSGIAVLGTWFFDDGRRISLLSRDGLRYATEPLLPFDQVAEWLDSESRQLPDGERLDLYLPIPLQSSLPLYLSRSRSFRVRLHEANRRAFRPNRDLDVAFASCREAGCDYLVVPVHRQGHLVLHPEHDIASLEAKQPTGIQRFDARHGMVFLVPPPPP